MNTINKINTNYNKKQQIKNLQSKFIIKKQIKKIKKLNYYKDILSLNFSLYFFIIKINFIFYCLFLIRITCFTLHFYNLNLKNSIYQKYENIQNILNIYNNHNIVSKKKELYFIDNQFNFINISNDIKIIDSELSEICLGCIGFLDYKKEDLKIIINPNSFIDLSQNKNVLFVFLYNFNNFDLFLLIIKKYMNKFKNYELFFENANELNIEQTLLFLKYLNKSIDITNLKFSISFFYNNLIRNINQEILKNYGLRNDTNKKNLLFIVLNYLINNLILYYFNILLFTIQKHKYIKIYTLLKEVQYIYNNTEFFLYLNKKEKKFNNIIFSFMETIGNVKIIA